MEIFPLLAFAVWLAFRLFSELRTHYSELFSILLYICLVVKGFVGIRNEYHE